MQVQLQIFFGQPLPPEKRALALQELLHSVVHLLIQRHHIPVLLQGTLLSTAEPLRHDKGIRMLEGDDAVYRPTKPPVKWNLRSELNLRWGPSKISYQAIQQPRC